MKNSMILLMNAFYEFPIKADGLPAHIDSKYFIKFRCNGCFMKPILGVCFKCN